MHRQEGKQEEAVSGCARYRGRILSPPPGGLGPCEALELARHLAGCASCRLRRDLQESLSRDLDRLPQVEVPSSFSRRVMQRLREVSPALRSAGAGLVLALLAAAGSAVWKISGAGGVLISGPRLEWGDTLSFVVAGFGRALFLLLSETFSWGRPAALGPFAPSSDPTPAVATLVLAGCLALLVIVVLAASSQAARSGGLVRGRLKLTR